MRWGYRSAIPARGTNIVSEKIKEVTVSSRYGIGYQTSKGTDDPVHIFQIHMGIPDIWTSGFITITTFRSDHT